MTMTFRLLYTCFLLCLALVSLPAMAAAQNAAGASADTYRVEILYSTLKGEPRRLPLPQNAFPGYLAIGTDGSLYMSAGAGNDGPLLRISPQGQVQPLIEPVPYGSAEADSGERVTLYQSSGPMARFPNGKLLVFFQGIDIVDPQHPRAIQPVRFYDPQGRLLQGKKAPGFYLIAPGRDGHIYLFGGIHDTPYIARVNDRGEGRLIPADQWHTLDPAVVARLWEMDWDPKGNSLYPCLQGQSYWYHPYALVPTANGEVYLAVSVWSRSGTNGSKKAFPGIYKARFTWKDGKPALSTCTELYRGNPKWVIRSLARAPDGTLYAGENEVMNIDHWRLLKLTPIALTATCDQARTPTERALCANPTLSILDKEMAERYHQAFIATATGSLARKALIEIQRAWLKTRDQCTDDACIQKAYKQRLRALGS
ncbi:MAG: lysozyme inhibitor LprI family protein [Sulfuriferula sp.]